MADGMWYYNDDKDTEQGPVPQRNLLAWLELGYLTDASVVRHEKSATASPIGPNFPERWIKCMEDKIASDEGGGSTTSKSLVATINTKTLDTDFDGAGDSDGDADEDSKTGAGGEKGGDNDGDGGGDDAGEKGDDDDEDDDDWWWVWPEGIKSQITWVLFLPLNALMGITIPPCSRDKYERYYPITFGMCMVWILALSIVRSGVGRAGSLHIS